MRRSILAQPQRAPLACPRSRTYVVATPIDDQPSTLHQTSLLYMRGRSASTEISTILLRAVGLDEPRKNSPGNTIANDNAIALAA